MVDISVFGSMVRPQHWMRLYNSLKTTSVSFELIAVGNKRPDFEMPINMRHIYTEVKPAQCAEIGVRVAKADLIMPIADDIILSSGALDKLYKQYKEVNNEKALISCGYIWRGIDCTGTYVQRFDINDPDSPLAPLCFLISKDIWMELGGIDRRFISVCWDLDIAMRVYEIGGIGVLCMDAKAEEIEGDSVLYNKDGWGFDRPLLDSLWMKDGILSKQRLSPVEPFIDKDILIINQGSSI